MMGRVKKWKARLAPFIVDFSKAEAEYMTRIAQIEDEMNADINDGWLYEYCVSEYGWFIRRVKKGKRQVLVEDSDVEY